jgi:hypothetical protein
VFALDRKGLRVQLAVEVVVVLAMPVVVLEVIGQPQYVVTATFAVLFGGLADPGGDLGFRAARLGVFALTGALVTLLGFGIGTAAWELVVLVTLVVTLICGLAVRFGLHRFVAALLLNIWFVIAITLPVAYKLDGLSTHAWSQALAWLGGSALWIGFVFIGWLARGRKAVSAPVAEIPGDISPRKLTRPIILFAVIRAIAIAIAVAIPFALKLPEADWMPIATIIAMKPSLEQSTLVAEQRLAGAILGAAVAAVLLLTVHDKHVLEVAIVLIFTLGIAIHGVNYALYTAAIACGVLIAIDIPHPTNLSHEALRVLYTFLGVGLAVLVMLLATQLGKRTAKTPAPQPT